MNSDPRTTVIVPMLIATLANGENLLRITVLSSLRTTNAADWQLKCLSLHQDKKVSSRWDHGTCAYPVSSMWAAVSWCFSGMRHKKVKCGSSVCGVFVSPKPKPPLTQVACRIGGLLGQRVFPLFCRRDAPVSEATASAQLFSV